MGKKGMTRGRPASTRARAGQDDGETTPGHEDPEFMDDDMDDDVAHFDDAGEAGQPPGREPRQPPGGRGLFFRPVGTLGEGGVIDPPQLASRDVSAVRTATVLENHQSPFLVGIRAGRWGMAIADSQACHRAAGSTTTTVTTYYNRDCNYNCPQLAGFRTDVFLWGLWAS